MAPQHKVIKYKGKEVEFWMTPVTLAERNRVQAVAKKGSDSDFALRLFCLKATDKNGNKLIPEAHVAELEREFPAALMELMMRELLENVDEDEDEEIDVDPKPSSRPSGKTTS